jgi:hypothetical protein
MHGARNPKLKLRLFERSIGGYMSIGRRPAAHPPWA